MKYIDKKWTLLAVETSGPGESPVNILVTWLDVSPEFAQRNINNLVQWGLATSDRWGDWHLTRAGAVQNAKLNPARRLPGKGQTSP